MKINLEVLYSCTIKRKKPWPKVRWIGKVNKTHELNVPLKMEFIENPQQIENEDPRSRVFILSKVRFEKSSL